MESDELFKFNNLKPMDFITTGLSFSCERPVMVKRLFSGFLKNANGSMVTDDFGNLVHYREYRMIHEIESTIHYVNTSKDYQEFFHSSQFMKTCFQENFKVFILDDLCSYGNTFIMGFKELKKLGAGYIVLVVAHAEFSIYNGELLKCGLIDEVITTNSILNEDEVLHDSITCYNMKLFK
jgi:phosphoribosylpyrophosphate synthetase